MRHLKLLFASIVVGLCMLPAAASAQVNIFQNACTAPAAQSSPACQTTGANTISGTGGVLIRVTKLIARLAAISAVILIIVGGLMYVTADGDSSKITSARKTITYALVGLVVIMLAQAIIVFIINKIYG